MFFSLALKLLFSDSEHLGSLRRLAGFALRHRLDHRSVDAPGDFFLNLLLDLCRVDSGGWGYGRGRTRRRMHQNRRGEDHCRRESHRGAGSPDRLPPARLENFVGDERDSLRNLFLRKRGQSCLRQAKALQFLAASRAGARVAFYQRPLASIQLAEKISFQVHFCAIHPATPSAPGRDPPTPSGASVSFRRSSAVYKRDFTVKTGQARISAISSNLKPW